MELRTNEVINVLNIPAVYRPLNTWSLLCSTNIDTCHDCKLFYDIELSICKVLSGITRLNRSENNELVKAMKNETKK